ncbi:MAG TPA: hypothetical protein VHO24_00115 [Opitutaceae bacterium]|nr:hypothetical protein [Opitutaceae bacterium]
MTKLDADADSTAAQSRRIWIPASKGLTAYSHALLIGGAILLLLYLWFTPKTPLNHGFGWDGVRYAWWVQNLSEDLAAGRVDSYYIGRIFPSFLVSIPARLFGIPVTSGYVVYGFCIANSLCAYLTGLFFLRACNALRISGAHTLLGVILLLATYPVTKQSGYSGVLTDLFALAASAAMLDCWIRGKRLGLAIAILVSMFCWASTALLGTFLLLCPRGSRINPARFSRAFTGAALALALVYASACVYQAAKLFPDGEIMPVATWQRALPVSLLIAAAYVFFVARAFFRAAGAGGESALFSGFAWKRLLDWSLIVPGVLILQRLMAPAAPSGTLSLEQFLIGGITRPGLFLVGDASYYGAMAVLGALFLPLLLRAAAELGTGLLLALGFGLALNLYPEARMTLTLAPFFVLVLVLALQHHRLTRLHWIFIAACQALSSKIWLPFPAGAADFEKFHTYPVQYSLMSFGPWMANDSFLLQGALLLAALAIAAMIFPRRPSEYGP